MYKCICGSIQYIRRYVSMYDLCLICMYVSIYCSCTNVCNMYTWSVYLMCVRRHVYAIIIYELRTNLIKMKKYFKILKYYVNSCVCACVCVCVCARVRARVCLCVCVCEYECLCVFAKSLCANEYLHASMYACIYVCMYIYVYMQDSW